MNRDAVRYGVFLRPDAQFCDEALRAMVHVNYQFGLSAALAYPPHITLVGSIALNPNEPCAYDDAQSFRISPRESQLVAAVDRAVASSGPQRLAVKSFALSENGFVYYAFEDQPGNCISNLMGAILSAVAPMRVYHDDDRTVVERKQDSPLNYQPHLTVLSHDGGLDPDVAREAYEQLLELGYGQKTDMISNTVSLYRFGSTTWSGEYWMNMKWRLLKSWKLT